MQPNNPQQQQYQANGQPGPAAPAVMPPGETPGQPPAQQPPQPQAMGGGQAPQPSAKNAKDAQKDKQPISTQQSLLFSEMRENMIIMADGSFRAIIACESINFDLMSSRERDGVEYSYQNFINSLTFPVQILIRSRRVDIGPYLDRLSHMRRSQDNMLLGVLMDDYINFIDILSQEANVMDKSFYIVVPYYPAGNVNDLKQQATGFFDSVFKADKKQTVKINQNTYDKAKDEIKNRIDTVMSGLFQMGVKSRQLNTKQLGELFYTVYNPETAPLEPMSNPEDLTATFIRKGDGEAPRLSGGEL